MDRKKSSALDRFLYFARDLRSGPLFIALAKHVRGRTLDLGGRDFFLRASRKGINAKSWVALEYEYAALPRPLPAKAYWPVGGDGCRLPFKDASFETAVCIQVLEHVLDPLRPIAEIARVLKKDGHAILLLPQTGLLHDLPHHYTGFMRPWIQRALPQHGLELIELKPLGGFWSSMASHYIHFFLKAFRTARMTPPGEKRNPLFYLLFPFMAVYALASVPVCMLFSLADLTEDPNNHLVVARRI